MYVHEREGGLVGDPIYIDDAVSDNAGRYFRQVMDRVLYNLERGNFDLATRWAQLLWSIAESYSEVAWRQPEDA
jgi:hypothetical protein